MTVVLSSMRKNIDYSCHSCHSCGVHQVEEEEEYCDQLFHPHRFHWRSNCAFSSIGRKCFMMCGFGFSTCCFTAVSWWTACGKSALFFIGPSIRPWPLTPRVRLFSYISRSFLVAVYEKPIDMSESKYWQQYSLVHPMAICEFLHNSSLCHQSVMDE